VCLKQVSPGFGVQRESRDDRQVVRCLAGFFTLAVKWVKRLRLGAETGGVLTGDERVACKQPTVIPVVTIGRRYLSLGFSFMNYCNGGPLPSRSRRFVRGGCAGITALRSNFCAILRWPVLELCRVVRLLMAGWWERWGLASGFYGDWFEGSQS